MTTTQKIIVEKAGGPDRLVLHTVPMPVPGPSEVRVRVEATGVAFADIMVREGRYPNVRVPVTPGYDLVGRIDALGDGVEDWATGDRVGALTVTGSYARHAIIPAAWAARVPDTLDAGTAVSLILNYVTAWQMLWRNTGVGEGDTVLVHGAAGGVGTALLDLCRLGKVRALGTASVAKHPVVADYGGVPIDYAGDDFVVRARAMTDGAGVDAVFDHLGGAHLKRSFAALRATGVLVSYGGLAAFRAGRMHLPSAMAMLLGQPRYAPLSLLSANKAVVGFDIAGRRAARPDWFAVDLSKVFALAEQQAIRPLVGARYPLAGARAAHLLLAGGETRGKVILDC